MSSAELISGSLKGGVGWFAIDLPTEHSPRQQWQNFVVYPNRC